MDLTEEGIVKDLPGEPPKVWGESNEESIPILIGVSFWA
jgi:hypothetical protein